MTPYKITNWKADKPDDRDYIYKAPSGLILPPMVDLRPFCSPVEDQGDLGSCTGNAIVGACELLQISKKVRRPSNLSRLFVYYNERVAINTVNEDSGAYIRDGIKSIAANGVCLESIWKYDIKKFTKKPTATAYKDAAKRKFETYHRIVTLDDMLGCLAEGFPFVFGFSVFNGIYHVNSTGLLPMPSGQELGGHAVLAVGYDKPRQLMIVRNSWGPEWGDKGYFYMPFPYINNPRLADDMWTIR